MTSVEEALKIIEDNILDLGIEKISLSNSVNRVLKESWHTDIDLPPYDRVTMDGIAIHFSSYDKGNRSFPIESIAAAGMPRKTLKNLDHCLEVMTGSIMPLKTDTVIRYEDLEIKNGTAKIIHPTINFNQNIHFKGEDRKVGDLVVKKDTLISPAEIGVGASLGKSEVLVARLPRVMVISTGDELVPINAKPLEHQIRRSNIYRLVTTLNTLGISADDHHFNDNEEELMEGLNNFLGVYDVIILSGGVSKGKFDFLPDVLSKLGVKKLFHKVKQRPGKPFWFGRYQDKCIVFALPGNPVSSFLGMQKYFKHWLQMTLLQQRPNNPYAILQKDVIFNPDLTYFLEVKISFNALGQILATPIKGNGSGDLANMVDADAFIELASGKNEYKKGEVYPILQYRKLLS
jgi:molybdopterin molybdotransferase